MKLLKIITAVAMLAASAVSAGQPAGPWERTPVYVPPEAVTPSWSGFYAGVGITKRQIRDRTVTEIPNGYVRECRLGDGRNEHSNNKCRVSALSFGDSPEIAALDKIDSPWSVAGLEADGNPGQIVAYDNVGYPGIWLNDNDVFSYTTMDGSDSGTDIVGRTFTDLVSLSDDEELTATVWGRMLRDQGTLVLGGEVGYYDGSGYLEGSAGLGMGNLHMYGGYGTNGPVAGVDLRLTNRLIVGVKGVFGDYDRAEARVGWQF